jgi:tape measure domain-containing protein
MRRAGGLAATTGTKIGQSLGSASGAIGGLVKSVGAATAQFAALGVATAAAASAAALFKGVKLAADMQSTSVAFETMLGSAESARKVLGELQKLGAETPFEFPELAGAGRMLLAFGESADTVAETLRRVGDVSSGVMAPIGEIAELYGKARVQGTLFSEDINQLTGRGIPIIQEFAKQLGVSQGEVKKLASEGKITFPMLETAFVSLTSQGGQFFGMMEKQSQTFNGVWSTLTDSINMGLADIGKPIMEALIPGMNMLIERIGKIDFAQMSERLVASFNMENIISMISASVPLLVAVLADAFAKALDVFGALLRALFSPEGLSFMKNILIDVLVAGVDAIGGAFYELAKNFGKALKGEVKMVDTTRIIGEAKPEEKAAPDFASKLQEELGQIDWAPSSAVTAAAGKFAEAFGKSFPQVPKQQAPQGDVYDKEAEEQRKRVAADEAEQKRRDSYNVPQIDGTTYGPPKPTVAPEQMGPPKEARSSRDGRLFGEAVRPSNRVFGEAGAPLGTDNVFAKDRERLGIASGMTTGGLGEKRRLNTSANDKEAKKNLSLQEQQAASLQSIESNIKSAVTVN